MRGRTLRTLGFTKGTGDANPYSEMIKNLFNTTSFSKNSLTPGEAIQILNIPGTEYSPAQVMDVNY